jgi:hypothetical protein
LLRVEEGIAQCIAGDGLELPIAQGLIARGAEIFVGQIDAGYAGVVG